MEGAAVSTFAGAGLLRRRIEWPLPATAMSYWLAIVGAATVGIVAALPRLQGAGHWGLFALLVTAAAAAQLSAVQLTSNRLFHPAIVFVVAGALLLTPQQLALMCVIQHVPDWFKNRYRWYIQPFNIANYVFAATAAALAATSVRHASLPANAVVAVGGIAAAVVFVAANRTLLLVMLRLGRGLSTRATGLFDVDDVALEVVLAMIAVPFAAFWARSTPTLAFLSLAPLVLILVTQRAQQRLEGASLTIQEQNTKLAETSQVVIERSTAALEALSATVDARDKYTAGHSRRVRAVSIAVGRQLGLSERDLETVAQAALLHDIGKIAVPDSVLMKAGPLDQAEWLLMRAHSEEGARIIERLGYLGDVVPAIRHHHERMDGRGYPAALNGEEIPVPARIIHVADSLDAMLTKRVYRDDMTLAEALQELQGGSGTDFDSACVTALEQLLESDAAELHSVLAGARR